MGHVSKDSKGQLNKQNKQEFSCLSSSCAHTCTKIPDVVAVLVGKNERQA